MIPGTPRTVTGVRAIKVRPGRHVEMPEHLATEEPMEIRVAGPGEVAEPLAVTMRTPGHDFELAAGFVVTEAIVARHEIVSVSYCDAVEGPGRYNTVTVCLSRVPAPGRAARRFAASPSCGICGKTSIEEVHLASESVPSAPPVPSSVIVQLPERLRAAQRIFDRTGGLHAAGLFSPDGGVYCVREDVGRHNAVDKVVGHTVLNNRFTDPAPLAGWVLMVSGRVSFELIQKAALAGVGTVAAVSAPSSLAVDAAEGLGVALVAFVRGESFNVYAHPERLALGQ